MSDSTDVSDALAADLAQEYPERRKRSKALLIAAAVVAVVLILIGVRRARAGRDTPLGGGINEISV